MCGITGLINLNGDNVSPAILKKMTASIAHRGPDGDGHWIEENVGLGHRRLSIIDLSPAGQQPMITANNRFVLTYNGEIYNHVEIRSELECLGYIFKSKTDSEVVLNALAQWGKDAIIKFNGMFSLALWDRKKKVLLLARDRYGIKPLYYAHQGNYFSFGSEQKAITSQSSFMRNINKAALLEYFTFQNIFTDQTLINDIYLLPAGHYAELNTLNGNWSQYRYWDFYFEEPELKIRTQDYIEELNYIFRQAVNRQLTSDVEIGSYLSGGIDSGSITAIATQRFSYLKTFTCGFDLSSASGIELGFDERYKAEAMSALFKTEHYEMVLKAGDMERCLSELTWHLEEPRVGQSYPNFYAAKLASKFVKVVLSGIGGDELFGGYPWRYYIGSSCKSFDDYIDEYYLYWRRLASQEDLKKMFAPIHNEVDHVCTKNIFRSIFTAYDYEPKKSEGYINHSLYFEAKTFLHGLLVVEDKLSMAHGLETRVPFLDNDLVNFAMRCPISLKLDNQNKIFRLNENESGVKYKQNYNKKNNGKKILRNVISKYIPNEITQAKKQGFSSPDASWFRGDSIEFVRSKILNNNSAIYQFLDRKTVEQLLMQHLDGKQNRRLLIWSLLNIEEWMKINL